MTPISLDLRQRIFDARQAGETTAEVAERFAVSTAFVRRLMQRYRATGSLHPNTGPRGFKPRLDAHADRIRELLTRHPDLHAAEVRDRLGLEVAAITVWRMLVRLNLTLKKSRPAPPSRTDPTLRRRGSSGRRPSPIMTPHA
jgi:transposase